MRALARRAPLAPRAVEVADPRDLIAIYEPDVAMAWWPRPPSAAAAQRLEVLTPFSWVREVDAGGAGLAPLEELLGGPVLAELCELVDWHASLFETETLGVRVALTEQPMCPGFHVDKVVCRLVWVMAGAGTEWVQGALPVEAARPVTRLSTGAAAWFKGASWPESCAIVHRSPPDGGRWPPSTCSEGEEHADQRPKAPSPTTGKRARAPSRASSRQPAQASPRCPSRT